MQLTTTVSNGWNYLRLPIPVRATGSRTWCARWQDHRTHEQCVDDGAASRPPSPGRSKKIWLHLFDHAGSGSTRFTTAPPTPCRLRSCNSGPVTPFNQPGAVASVMVVFSEAIDTNTFAPTALTLTRDGGANLISGGSAVSLTLVSSTTCDQRIGAFTSTDGNYQLTLNIGGIFDLWGNNGSGNATTAWAKGTVAPVVQSISAVTPNPRNVPVASVVVTFEGHQRRDV